MDKPFGINFNRNALNIQNLPTYKVALDQQPVLKQQLITDKVHHQADENVDQQQQQPKQQEPLAKSIKDESPMPSPPKLSSGKLSSELETLEPLIQLAELLPPPQAQLQPTRPFHDEPAQPQQQQVESLVSRIPKLSWVPSFVSKQSFISTSTPKETENTSSTATADKQQSANTATSTPTESDDEEIEDIDKLPSRDAVFSVCDIAKDIYNYMHALEDAQVIREDYLKDEKIFTPKIRQRLINWCVDTHSKLELLPETLYMTVALIDRFFDRFSVKQQNQVHLAGIGALLIASKYEEIYPPEVSTLVHLSGGKYSKSEVLRVEILILERLNFDLGRPIPLAFLRRFSAVAHCDLKLHSIAKYLMELSLTEYECAHWRPSLLAAASLFTSLQVVNGLDRQPFRGLSLRKTNENLTSSSSSLPSASWKKRWNKSLVHYTTYSKEQLQGPVGILCKILRRSQKNPQSFNCATKNKPNLTKWPELKSARVDELIRLGERIV